MKKYCLMVLMFVISVAIISCDVGSDGSLTSATTLSTSSLSTASIVRVDSSVPIDKVYVNGKSLSCTNYLCQFQAESSSVIVITDDKNNFVAAATLNSKSRTLINAVSTGHYLFKLLLSTKPFDKHKLIKKLITVLNLPQNSNVLNVYKSLGLYYWQLYKTNQQSQFTINILDAVNNQSFINIAINDKLITSGDSVTDVAFDLVQDTTIDCIADGISDPLFDLLGINSDNNSEEEQQLEQIQNEIDEINQNIIELQDQITELEGSLQSFQDEYETDVSNADKNDIYDIITQINNYYNSYINLIGVDGSLDDYLSNNGLYGFQSMHNILNSSAMNTIATSMDILADSNNGNDLEYLYQLMTDTIKYPEFQNQYIDVNSTVDLLSEQNSFDNTQLNLAISIAEAQQEAYILELGAANIDYNYADDKYNVDGAIPIDESLNLSQESLNYQNVESALSTIYLTRNNSLNTLTEKYYQDINHAGDTVWPNGAYKSTCRTYFESSDLTTQSYYTGESMALYCTTDDSVVESATPSSKLAYTNIDLYGCESNNVYTKNGILQCATNSIYMTTNPTDDSASIYRCSAK